MALVTLFTCLKSVQKWDFWSDLGTNRQGKLQALESGKRGVRQMSIQHHSPHVEMHKLNLEADQSHHARKSHQNVIKFGWESQQAKHKQKVN